MARCMCKLTKNVSGLSSLFIKQSNACECRDSNGKFVFENFTVSRENMTIEVRFPI